MSNHRIFLVSRDELLIALCKRSIDHEIGTVMIAADCNETLDAVENDVPQLVILDTAATGSDCLGLTGYLSRSLDIPVIVIGNSSLKSEKLRYLESGIESFIDRPVDPEELNIFIRLAIQKRTPSKRKPPLHEFISGSFRIDYSRRRVTVMKFP